ncbi:Periplasmic oligopeptide-binding protein [bacterium HR40]|nr:Periplasmic oligopeptide-binding protein [bacterium HR40]
MRYGERRLHPGVYEMQEQLRRGRCDRREFLRTVCLLGVSASAAYAMAGRILGERLVDPVAAQAAKQPCRGGILRVSMEVPEIRDPATFDWVQKSNCTRHMLEYLTYTGPDGVTRPYLAERWEASEDLKTWTFYLRRGVKWSNGDTFNADDVVFNFTRWLDPKTGSSNLGLFSAMTEEYDTGEKNPDGTPKKGRRMLAGAVEKVDEFTVRLHLSRPSLSIPENLWNYPTAIVHRGFDEHGSDIFKWPVGTGPYSIADYAVGAKCILKRRPGTYWGETLDDPYIGGPIWLDEIHYYDHGAASAAQLAAFASGQVDMVHEFGKDSYQMAQAIPGAVVYDARTAHTCVMRMQVDVKPFDDWRVRRAIQLCCDASVYPDLIYFGRGMVGEHHHVAPIHPEYFKLPPLKQDHEQARKLLAEAGYGNGLTISIDCGNTNGPWQQQMAELFREQLRPAGITLNINVMPPSQYWEIWTKTPFGVTEWYHRPLGTMVLSLAYRCGVPWNESHYCNPDFEAALDAAEATLDVEQRRRLMEKVESILQHDAVIVQPLWIPRLYAAHQRVRNLVPDPSGYHLFHRVWIDAC